MLRFNDLISPNLQAEMANLKRRLLVKGTRNWHFVPTEQSKNRDD